MPRSLISLLLAASVLAGQWLAATHDSDHGMQPGAGHNCAICVYAHGAGTGALPVLPVVAIEAPTAAPVSFIPAILVSATVCNHPIRGPPSFLV